MMLLLISIGVIGFSTNIYAKNDNTGNKLVLSQKYNGKKLDRIKSSIKTNKNYRFLIDSNQGLEAIKDFFVTGDKKAKVKQVGEHTYMVRLPLNSSFLSEELSQIDAGTIPGTIGGYEVVEPEIVEGLGFSIPILNPFPLVKEKGATLGTLSLGILEGSSTGTIEKVGVLDTGIDYTHTDLSNHYNSTLSYDFINEDTDAMDDNGHGTQVSGLITNSELIGLKVLDANGLGTTYDILEAIDYAKTNNIKVLNMSFGGIGDASTSTVCVKQSHKQNKSEYIQ
ncbi:MAG: S8 family serine peptidase [Candidatus Gracilibacteria bacterium]|nr:S8 family serine peptidase [Candidatus Gracilibacteria bacterium]